MSSPFQKPCPVSSHWSAPVLENKPGCPESLTGCHCGHLSWTACLHHLQRGGICSHATPCFSVSLYVKWRLCSIVQINQENTCTSVRMVPAACKLHAQAGCFCHLKDEGQNDATGRGSASFYQRWGKAPPLWSRTHVLPPSPKPPFSCSGGMLPLAPPPYTHILLSHLWSVPATCWKDPPWKAFLKWFFPALDPDAFWNLWS